MTEINAMSRDQFVETLGWAFEHSPWVAERAWARRPFSSAQALHAALVDEVEQALESEQLALLRAHPDLGARAEMSLASVGEQSAAGLDRLTPDEYTRLLTLNRVYREKFGFPFLLAVRGSTKHDILAALERRSEAAPQQEFREALAQVYRIASYRLRNALTD